jgi:hypothetical protein
MEKAEMWFSATFTVDRFNAGISGNRFCLPNRGSKAGIPASV